jgi:SsrA-binding protein
LSTPAAATQTIVKNRKAYFDYEIEEEVEAGLVLKGTEVKSLRAGKAQMTDAYARVERGEAFLVQLHISEYEFGNLNNHEPLRVRKLLLKKTEIERLRRKVAEKGLTLIPLELYWKNGKAKVKLGLCRGKKAHDKRRTIRDRDVRREIERER